MVDVPAPRPGRRVALRSAKDPWDVISAGTTLRRNVFRNNAGNLVFSHAAHRTLTTSTTAVESNRFAVGRAEADRLNDSYDAFVVPLANAFRPSFREALIRLTAMIERLRIPVVVLGVGAQTGLDYDLGRLSPLDDAVKRFVAAVLDRSASIGVRGELTYDYLRQLGFADVEVIGCPAMFFDGHRLEATELKPGLDAASKVSIGVSPYVKRMGPIVTHHLAAYPELTYLPQDITTLNRLLRGEPHPERGAHSEIPVHLSHPLFTENRVRFFIDVPPWVDYLRQRDFYFGSRIHGAMVALLAGVPAVVLAHDSRTLELARYHEIPHRLISRVPPEVDAAQLYAEADFGPMHRGHAARFEVYRRFLERNGLDHVHRSGEASDGFDRKVTAASFPPAVTAPSRAMQHAQRLARRTHHTLVRGS